MLLARGALELIFVRKNAKTQKSLSGAYVFDSRRAFVGNGKRILQWQRDYREQTLQTLCVFLITQNARVPPTMENVAYAYFVKMLKNKNALRMLTRDTIAHTPNSAGSTYHSLVSMPSPFFENVLESFTRQ